MRFALTVGCCLMLAARCASAAATADSAASDSTSPPRTDLIRSADLMKTVEFLASKPLAGRLAGSPGYWKAARAMAARFERAGLAAGGINSFFQPLEVEYETIPTCRLAIVDAAGAKHELRLGPDFTCRGLTGSGRFTAPVVFAGYGVADSAQRYDDYAGVDVRGTIVLLFKEPPPFRRDSSGWGRSLLPRPTARIAAAHGARAMLLVSRPLQPEPQAPIGSMLEGDGPEDEHFPMLQVSDSAAQLMLRPAGFDLRALEAAIDSTRAPHSRTLNVSAEIDVRAHYRARQPSANVIGILYGTDPKLTEQALVIGAHLDHVGSQGSIYFPGANDNASGAAGVVAVAEAFARGPRPRRTVIFALFSSEESGLYGSKRFVEHPPVPLEKIVAYFNLDCIGHGDSIRVGGGATSPKLWRIARDLDAKSTRLMVGSTGAGGGADAAPFAAKKIPTLYFDTKNSYRFLHLPGDVPATLNPPLYEALVRLVYGTAWRVAQGEYTGG
jgi:aminopeptidase YwaD